MRDPDTCLWDKTRHAQRQERVRARASSILIAIEPRGSYQSALAKPKFIQTLGMLQSAKLDRKPSGEQAVSEDFRYLLLLARLKIPPGQPFGWRFWHFSPQMEPRSAKVHRNQMSWEGS